MKVSCLSQSLKDACVPKLCLLSTGEISIDEVQDEEKSLHRQSLDLIFRDISFVDRRQSAQMFTVSTLCQKGNNWCGYASLQHISSRKEVSVLFTWSVMFSKAAVWQIANKSRDLQKEYIINCACLGRFNINPELLIWLFTCARRCIEEYHTLSAVPKRLHLNRWSR